MCISWFLLNMSYKSINLPLYVFRLVNSHPQGVTVLKHRLYIYCISCYIHMSKTLKYQSIVFELYFELLNVCVLKD
jgi:hypothetical protein